MATENVKVLRIDTDPAKTSVKELRNELKELRNTMLSCEEGTEEYNNALRQAAEIQHTLKEQMEQVNATAMDFGQIASNTTKAMGGIVAGFQAATAAMNLFGVENEEVLKAMQKMQSLMAITQALPSIDNGIKAFKRLGIAIKGAAASMNGLKAALISTGIGAAIVAIGLLAANWDKVTDAMKRWGIINEDTKKKLDEQKKKVEELRGELAKLEGDYDKWERDLKVGKLNSKAKKSYDDLGESITRYEKQLEIVSKKQQLPENQSRKNWEALNEEGRKLLENIRILKNQQDAILNNVDSYKKLENETRSQTIETQKLIDKYTTLKEKLDELVTIERIAPDETLLTVLSDEDKKVKLLEKEAKRFANILNDVNKEFKEGITEVSGITREEFENVTRQYLALYGEYGSKLLQVVTGTGIYKREGSLFAELREEREKQLKEDHERELNDTIELIDTTYELAQAKLKQQYDEGLISEKEYNDRKLELQQNYIQDYIDNIQFILDTETELTDEQILDLTNKINNARELLKQNTESDTGLTIADGITEAINASALALSEFSDNPAWGKVLQNLAIISANWDVIHKQMKEGGTKAASAYLQVMGAAIGAIGAMLNGLAAEQDATSREGFESQKNLQVAGATMNMLAGIVSAWASAMQLGPIAGPIVGAILSAMMLGTGIANIVKIENTKFDGGGGGYGSSATPNTSAINSVIAPVQYTRDVDNASIEGAIKNQKVYVTETDITNTQNKVHVAESESRF